MDNISNNKTRKKRSIIWTLPKEDFQIVLNKFKTYTDALNYFGYKSHGGVYRELKKRIAQDGLNDRHILENKTRNRVKNILSDEEVFCENSKYGRKDLKKRMIKLGVAEICDKCKLNNEWNSEKYRCN
jgi:hypothetical protein